MATSSSVVLVDSGGAVSSLRLQEMLHARGGSEKVWSEGSEEGRM